MLTARFMHAKNHLLNENSQKGMSFVSAEGELKTLDLFLKFGGCLIDKSFPEIF